VSAAELHGDPLVPGHAEGSVLRLDAPLSFWGGVDPATGRIVDVHHPQHGETVAGRVLVMPSARGSSSSSSTLLECVRTGNAPAAILLGRADAILPVGAVVARELYGRGPTVIRLDALIERLHGDEVVSIDPEGRVVIKEGTA
jgi:predicted aconitase with swiveling domain